MKTIVIYVTYNADIDLLRKSIKSIYSQIHKIIIIDNTPNKDINLEKIKNDIIEIIYLENNLGIAKAQNIGIKKALENSYDYIMLSDQDTIYPGNYINSMLEVFNLYDNVAGVGSRFIDCNKNYTDGFIALTPIIFKQFYPKFGKHEVMQLISSGTIINAKYLNNIGLMEEKLFIDWVDLEWCWRARKKGYKIIGNADIIIEHRLGNFSRDIGFREVNLRNPIRHYYITRNAFYLSLRDKNLDFFHKLTLFLKSFRYILGYPILSKPHEENLKYVLVGFYHGLFGKLGKYKEKNK